MSDLLRLQAALDARPFDHGLRLMLADVYEELGDSVWADACRWLARKERVPRHHKALEMENWAWWDEERGGSPHGPDDLPSLLMMMRRAQDFRSPKEAYAYVMHRWLKLGTIERNDLWKWEPKAVVFVEELG